MFTGIVEEIGKVISAQGNRLSVRATSSLAGIKPGGSMAVNGVCLTVTTFDNASFAVDVMAETLRHTNLGKLRPGDEVNLERPLTLGGEVGGHLVQGHIDDTGSVVSVVPEGEGKLVTIEAPESVMRYVVPKGFIAVDGASLTVVDRTEQSFRLSLVGFTQHHTTLGSLRPGRLVNLEVDIMAKYVEQFIQVRRPGLTMEALRESGFTGAERGGVWG